MALKAQALLLNWQVVESWTLDNPEQEKSRNGDPHTKKLLSNKRDLEHVSF